MSFGEQLDKIVRDNRNQLIGRHPSWGRVRLVDIATILNGFPFESTRFSRSADNATPLIRIRDIKRSTTETHYTGEFDPDYLVRSGDLLVGMDGDFNSAVWRGSPGLLNQRVCKIVLQSPCYDNRLLSYCLPGYLSAINAYTSSITVKHLSSRTVAETPLPLPPLPEQARIADALDELFSDLDAGVVALERARAKLKLYRASVLKAAVEGALTAEWRAKHPHAEPASELLKRILVERRRRWEEVQLAKFKAKGQEPPKNWKTKYNEPVAPDTTSLPPLPASWCWATVGQCSAAIQYGSSSKTSAAAAGVPVLRMGNLRSDGSLVLDDLKYLPVEHGEFPELLLKPGDLLFNRTNSAELVGKTGLFKGVPNPCSFASYLIRVRVVDGLIPAIMTYSLNGILGRRWVKDVANQTVGQANVNGTKLAGFAFPLSPLAEQEAIVEAGEDQLSVIDHLEADIDAKLKSAQALRRSILRHAFSGRLVPQDPNDELASELLKRIAAEREAQAGNAAVGRRGQKRAPKPSRSPFVKGGRRASRKRKG